MTCSRCSSALVTPEQFERGLCATCWTGASLSALVGIAAETHAKHQRSDSDWKNDQFTPTPEVQ